MSLIGIAWRAHPDFPLVMLMNHDGLHDQALTPAQWRQDGGNCFAGNDEAGGAWLGVTREGVLRQLPPFVISSR